MHIFQNAHDQVSFVAKILDRYLFNPEHDYGEEKQTQVIQMMKQHVALKVDDLLRQMNEYFDC